MAFSPRNEAYSQIQGIASATDTSATEVIAAPDTDRRLYIVSICFANTGSSTTRIQVLSDTTPVWTSIAPAGGGSNFYFGEETPLILELGEAAQFQCEAASTTVYASFNAYIGP
jgi:hypothetical protein